MKISKRLLLSLVAVGGCVSVVESPARAQVNNNVQNFQRTARPIPLATKYARPQVLAFLLDPQNNPKPAPFAPWPGLPIEQDLTPQAAELFDDSPAFQFRLPEGVQAVTPNNNGNGLIVWALPAAMNNLGSIGAFVNSVDIANPSIEVDGELVSFGQDLPKPLDQMANKWDGKTTVVKTFTTDELDEQAVTKADDVQVASCGSLTLTSTKPKAMRAKSTTFPQTNFRVTGVVGLQNDPTLINDDSPVGLVVESGDDAWDAVVAPDVGVGNITVILLPDAADDKNQAGRANFLFLTVNHVRPSGQGQ